MPIADLADLTRVRRPSKADRVNKRELEKTLVARMGEVLRKREAASGLTRTEFAKAAGVPRQTYYEILEGTANMRLRSIEAIADALDMNVYELLGVPLSIVNATAELARVKMAVLPKEASD